MIKFLFLLDDFSTLVVVIEVVEFNVIWQWHPFGKPMIILQTEMIVPDIISPAPIQVRNVPIPPVTKPY